jgi:hypothetical protein
VGGRVRTDPMTARVLAATAIWFGVAVLAGGLGVLDGLRPPLPQVILVTLTLALLAAFRWWGPLRAWALTVDIRALVLIHVTRFVGIYFLVVYRRGELPYAFAVPGGRGDIVVAAGALLVAGLAPRHGRIGRALYAGWNLVGLADILLVVATAGRLAIADPASMRALTVLPLSLLPTFLVPIIIASHVVIFTRLSQGRRDARRPP